MATAKTKAIKAPKVATKVTKATRISTGSVLKPSKITIPQPKKASVAKSTVKSVGIIKAPNVKIAAPKSTLTKPKVYEGAKAPKGIA